MKYCIGKGGQIGVSIALLVFILVWAYMDPAYVAADHMSEKERGVYLEEIEAEYKNGTLSVENYKAKLEFLEDHDWKGDPKDRPKESWSITMAILGAVIPIAVVGVFLGARIRRRNQKQEQVAMPYQGVPLQGDVETDGKPKGMGEIFRDKNRDNLTQALNSIGIQATMLERGRQKRKYATKLWAYLGHHLESTRLPETRYHG